MKKISFLIFMSTCIAIFCAMGVWQIKRLHWKENLIAQLGQAYAKAPEPPFVTADAIRSLQRDQFLRGMFRGHLDFAKSFDLQGQIDNGQLTAHKIVPYIISKDLTILVDFGPGFTLRNKDNGNTVITGLLRHVPQRNRFTPDNHTDQKIWYSLDPAQLNIKNLKPLEILPEHTPWKEFPAQKPELRNAHLQYAIFWFTMAVITALMTFYYLSRKQD